MQKESHTHIFLKGGWRDSSAVNSVYYSFRGSTPSNSRPSEILLTSKGDFTHVTHIHTDPTLRQYKEMGKKIEMPADCLCRDCSDLVCHILSMWGQRAIGFISLLDLGFLSFTLCISIHLPIFAHLSQDLSIPSSLSPDCGPFDWHLMGVENNDLFLPLHPHSLAAS